MSTCFADGPNHVGGGAAGRYAHHNVDTGGTKRLQVGPSLVNVVLGTLHGVAKGRIAPCNHAPHPTCIHPKGGRQLASIQHAQPTAGARSHVEHTPSLAHTHLGLLHKGLYAGNGPLHSIGHAMVLPVDVAQYLSRLHLFQMAVGRGLFCNLVSQFHVIFLP